MGKQRGWKQGKARLCWTAALPLLALGACDDSPPDRPVVVPPTPTPTPTPPPQTVTPAGRLTQAGLRGPIDWETLEGWRVTIREGEVTVKPPEASGNQTLQYVSRGTKDYLGTRELKAWMNDRRSIRLPGGAKITMHGQGSQLLRVSLYDVDESHEIDALTDTLMHSQVSGAVSTSRDDAEHDGETAHLGGFSPVNTVNALYLRNLYTQDAATDDTPGEMTPTPWALGRQFADGVHPYAFDMPEPAAETNTSCDATALPRGRLVQGASNAPLEYVTRSGLWTIKIDKHTITLTRHVGDVSPMTWQVWGDPHENLNGKHIKDWLGNRRTLLLDDGTKITMEADGPHHVVHTTSIYDGGQNHQISNATNLIQHSCVDAEIAAQRDAAQHDGETAMLVNLRSPEATIGSLYVENFYEETAPSRGPFLRAFDPEALGETGEIDTHPTQVNDLYDDQRLGHT